MLRRWSHILLQTLVSSLITKHTPLDNSWKGQTAFQKDDRPHIWVLTAPNTSVSWYWQPPTQVLIGTNSLPHKCQLLWTASSRSAYWYWHPQYKYLLVLTASITRAHWYWQLPSQVPIGTGSFHHKCLLVLAASITSAYWYWQLPP